MRSRSAFTLLIGVLLVTANAVAAPVGLSFQGRLVTPSGLPLEGSSVTLTFSVTNPLGTCLLYEESQTLNMSGSDGIFSVTIGSGTRTANDKALTLSQVFSNSAAKTGLNCGSYTPATTDSRNIYVGFNDGVSSATFPTPYAIQSVPYALDSEMLAGKSSSDFLQVTANSTQTKLNDLMVPATYAELLALINGTTSQYAKTGSGSFTNDVNLNSHKISGVSAPTVSTDAANKAYVDSYVGGKTADTAAISALAAGDSGKVLSWSGTQWTVSTPGADNTKLPLAGGTMTGPIAMGANNITGLGYLTQGAGKYFQIGTFDNTAETTLSGALLPAHQGATWYNTTSNELKFWTGTQVKVVSQSIGSQSANQFLASPNGAAGVPTYRAIVAADLPVTGAGGAIVNGGNTFGAASSIGNTDAFDLSLKTNNTARMTILSGGNVGVGTTSPLDTLSVGTAPVASATRALVNVSNTAIVGGSANGTYIGANPATFTGNFMDLQVAGASKFRVDKDGKIYGDASTLSNLPAAISGLTAGRVPLSASASTISDSANFTFNSTTGAMGIGGSSPSITSGDAITIAAGGTNKNVVLTPSGTGSTVLNGSVGVGTTSPSTKFDVNGSGRFFDQTAATGLTLVTLKAGAGQTTTNLFEVRKNDNTLIYSIENTGTPVAATDLVHKSYADTTASTAGGLYLKKDGTVALTAAWNAGGQSIGNVSTLSVGTVTAPTGGVATFNGNVGIGTTSPSQKLDVAGNMALSTGGYIYGDTTNPYVRLNNSAGLVLGYNTNSITVTNSFATFGGSGIVSQSISGLFTGGGLRLYGDSNTGAASRPITLNAYNGSAYRVGLQYDNVASGEPNLVLVPSAGNVGIGTTAPLDILSIGTAPVASATRALVNFSNTAIVGGSANGTYIGANPATFTGNFIDLQVAGVRQFSVSNAGVITGNGSGLTGVTGTISGLTAGRVPLSASATSIADSANFTFNSTTGAMGLGGTAPSITSGDAITIAAGGTNKNVVLTPSGTGSTVLNGNVGIGTTTPGALLHAFGTAASTTMIIDNQKGSAGGTAVLQFGLSDGSFITNNAAQISARVTSNPNMALDFRTYHSSLQTDMTLTGGNLGIGNTSPSYKLDINGGSAAGVNLRVAGSHPDGGVVRFENTSASGGRTYHVGSTDTTSGAGNGFGVYDVTGSASRFLINPSGSVGVGTTNPQDKVHVANAGPMNLRLENTANSNGVYVRSYTTTQKTAYGLGIATVNAPFEVYDETAGRLMLTSTQAGNITLAPTVGNVGIGTTSPTAALHLKAGTATASTAPLKFTSGTNLTTPESGAIEFDGTSLYYTDSTPTRRTIATTTGVSASYVAKAGDTMTGPLVNNSNSASTTLAVTQSGAGYASTFMGGNVGIGTTTPAIPLSVLADASNNGIRVLSTTTPASYYLTLKQADGTSSLVSTSSDLALTAGSRLFFTASGGGWGTTTNFTTTTPMTYATTDAKFINANTTWAPTAGAGNFIGFNFNPVINQSGTASGGYTGMLINVSETAVLGTDKRLLDLQSTGTSRLVVKSDGNVGIGTTSPSVLLDVNGKGKVSNVIMGDAVYGGGKIIQMGGTTNAFPAIRGAGAALSLVTADESGFIDLTVNNLTVNGTLAVPFGALSSTTNVAATTGLQTSFTTSATSNGNTSAGFGPQILLKADAADSAAYNVGAISSFWLDPAVATRSSAVSFSTVNSGTMSEKMRIDNDGNVGIGTTSPSTSLEISGAQATTGFKISPAAYKGYGIAFGSGVPGWIDSTSPNARIDSIGNFVFNSGSGGDNYFNYDNRASRSNYFDGVNRFNAYDTSKSSLFYGNVGIGTTSPGSKLDVNGQASFGTTKPAGDQYTTLVVGARAANDSFSTLEINPTSTATRGWHIDAYDPGTTAQFFQIYDDVNDSTRLKIDNNGNVGVGTTTPSAKLDVNATAGTIAQFKGGSDSGVIFGAGGLVGFSDAAGNNGFIFNSASNYAYIQTNGSEKLRVLSTGNVGIGTTSPSQKLHVNGITQSDSAFYVGTATGTEGGDDNLIKTSSSSAFLNIKGGTGKSKITIGNDLLNLISGPSAGIRFNYAASSSTNVGTTGLYFSETGGLSLGATYVSTNPGAGNLIVQGNVGIGTTNPTSALTVEGKVNFLTAGASRGLVGPPSWDSSYTSFQNGSMAETAANSAINQNSVGTTIVNAASGQALHFRIGNGASMIINSASNVGVGTTSPNEKLEVNGNIRLTPLNGGGTTTASIDNNGNIIRTASDERLKTQIEPLEGSLDRILKVQGVSYYWKNQESFGSAKDIGFIAQDLEKVVPEVVKQSPDPEHRRSVSYANMVALLVEAIKEMYQDVTGHSREIASLKAENAQLRLNDDVKSDEMARLKLNDQAKAKEIIEMKARLDKLEKALNSK